MIGLSQSLIVLEMSKKFYANIVYNAVINVQIIADNSFCAYRTARSECHHLLEQDASDPIAPNQSQCLTQTVLYISSFVAFPLMQTRFAAAMK